MTAHKFYQFKYDIGPDIFEKLYIASPGYGCLMHIHCKYYNLINMLRFYFEQMEDP